MGRHPRAGPGGGRGRWSERGGGGGRALSVEGRMTLCNMSIEAGAREGMVAPDETTFAYLEGRPFAPRGDPWGRALAHWRTLPSDLDPIFDREITFDAALIPPTVTWGTSPQHALPNTER